MTISCIVLYQGQDDTTKLRTLQKGSWSDELSAFERIHTEEGMFLSEGSVAVSLMVSADTVWSLINTALVDLRKTGRVDADEYLLNKTYGLFGERRIDLHCIQLYPRLEGIPAWKLFTLMRTDVDLYKEITDRVLSHIDSKNSAVILKKWAEKIIQENTDTLVLQLKPSRKDEIMLKSELKDPKS